MSITLTKLAVELNVKPLNADGCNFSHTRTESCITFTFSARMYPRFVPLNARSLTVPAVTCDPAVLFRTLYYNNLEIKTRRFKQDVIGVTCTLRHSLFCALRSDG
jgi:hypothetical protein